MSRITGADEVKRNLAKVEKDYVRKVGAATLAAGLHVQGVAMENAPIDQGDLRGSAFTERTSPVSAVVGFAAGHAAAVHEDVEGFGKYNKGDPKFLERAAQSEGNAVLGIYRRRLST